VIARRGFITLIGGAAAASVSWPLAAREQQPTMPLIGVLGSASAAPFQAALVAFRDGLKEVGYVEGQNVAIQYRWAEDRYDRLPVLAAELVRLKAAVIIASGGPAAALAARSTTATVPIVFTAVSDPVALGLVGSLNRPGGNITGTSALTIEVDAKRLQLLLQLVPTSTVLGALVNPSRPDVETQIKSVQAAARSLGLRMVLLNAGNERELDSAFAKLVQQQVRGLLIGADPFFNSRRRQILALAAHHTLPTIYAQREFADDGGLISYGSRLADGYHQAGIYAGRILNGANPAELPVVQPTKFDLIINLKTAKPLDLEVPPTLLATADEVIE
jgi:putative ABC transport system substrate-binding protein